MKRKVVFGSVHTVYALHTMLFCLQDQTNTTSLQLVQRWSMGKQKKKYYRILVQVQITIFHFKTEKWGISFGRGCGF